MTDHDQTEGAGAPGERELRFDVARGLALEVTSASGDLRVRVVEVDAGRVVLRTSDPHPERRLALVECTYDEAANRLTVDTKAVRNAGGSRSLGLKSALTRLLDTAHHDVDVDVAVPEGTSVRYRTASGNLEADGVVASLDVSCASGDVSVGAVSGSTKFHSASGDFRAARVSGAIKVKSASGDVRVARVDGDVRVQSVSGDVALSVSSPVGVEVNSVSGDVVVGVRPGLLIDIDAKSLSGNLTSEITLDGASGATGERAMSLKVRSVSGDVTVRRDADVASR